MVGKPEITPPGIPTTSATAPCLFIYITHDLEFAKSRTLGQKFAVRDYDGKAWDIVDIPDDGSVPEEITTRILGSRKPILFVEGEGRSIDANLYGKIYPEFTIIPVGSCEHVIRLTISYNSRKDLHHLACYGLMDRDGRSCGEMEYLKGKNIYVTEFAEIENVLLLGEVLAEVSQMLAFGEEETQTQLREVKAQLFGLVTDDEIEKTCVRFTKRKIGAAMAAIGFESKTLKNLKTDFNAKLGALDPEEIFEEMRLKLEECLRERDYRKLLEIYDNKGMVRQIGRRFGLKADEYPEFVVRQMGSDAGGRLIAVIRAALPDLDADGRL